MKLELVIVAYEGEEKASTVLKTLEQVESHWEVALSNAAILVHRADGQVKVKETHDWDAGQGALFGIVVGGLVGAVMGPVGALVGATAAGAAGAVVLPLVDLGIPNQYLTQVHELLPPGHSALVVIVRTKGLERLLTELSQESDKVLHWTLEGDFEPALDATLPEIREQFDSLWYRHAAMRKAAGEKLEAELAALERQIVSADAAISQAKPNAPAELRLRLEGLRANQAALLLRLQALYEDELQSQRSAISEITAETALAKLQGETSLSKEIEWLEAEQDAVLQKLEANLKAQLSFTDAEIQALRHEGAPDSLWLFAYWDHQTRQLEEEREAVLEKQRLNLEEQRRALDRTMARRRTEAENLCSEARREHEIALEALGVRRGELMQELGLMSDRVAAW